MTCNDWNLTEEVIDIGSDYYFGEINKEKKPNGFGILLGGNGLSLDEGYWENGKLFGTARQLWVVKNDVIGITEGSFKASKWDGYCTQTYSNGESYQGFFIDDLWEGLGKYIYQDGHVYEGNHKHDKSHGHGKISYPDGVAFSGEWKDSKMNGLCLHTKKDFIHVQIYEDN